MGRFGDDRGNDRPRSGGPNRGFRGSSQPREMHKAVCDECKKITGTDPETLIHVKVAEDRSIRYPAERAWTAWIGAVAQHESVVSFVVQ